METPLYDLSPALALLLGAIVLAAGPLAWVLVRKRHAGPLARYHGVAMVTLFLTFDLVLFGAFTRLTDSGLGCPDWPGCYGKSTPSGARAEIAQAQAELPGGPVTHGKAWVEMVHRYLASAVGFLIVCLTAGAWWLKRRLPECPVNPWLPTFTLLWVCLQGAFGAWTVTMKLLPAIVSLHLLGGYALLALTVWLMLRSGQALGLYPATAPVSPGLWWGMFAALSLLVLQAASGAWVSTNYAVLACTEFPKCQGQWIPAMDWQGFEWWRPLGMTASGQAIGFQSLVTIHWLHRSLALLTATVLLSLALYALRKGPLQRPARLLVGLVVLQLLTGLSNIVLGWPLLAAVLHTGGAGVMIATLGWMLTGTRPLAKPSANGRL